MDLELDNVVAGLEGRRLRSFREDDLALVDFSSHLEIAPRPRASAWASTVMVVVCYSVPRGRPGLTQMVITPFGPDILSFMYA